MPTILPISHTPVRRRPRPLHGHTPPTAGAALAEYGLFMLLGAIIVLPAIQQIIAVLMQYYQILIVAAAGG